MAKQRVELTGPEAAAFARQHGLPVPKGAALVKVTVAPSEAARPRFQQSADGIQPVWGMPRYYLQNIRWTEGCGTAAIRSTSGQGPASLSLEVHHGVNATWHANVGISASIVSAGIGFDVTSDFQITALYQVEIPAGETWAIRAYPTYDIAAFEVWHNPLVGDRYRVGQGEAHIPSGVCFVVYDFRQAQSLPA